MASQLAPIDPEDAKQITANDLVESDKLAKLARMRQLYGDLSDDPEWRKEWRRLFPEAAAEYLRAEWFGDDDALKSPPFLQRPDLHVLIAKYGAFSKIPPEAWPSTTPRWSVSAARCARAGRIHWGGLASHDRFRSTTAGDYRSEFRSIHDAASRGTQ